MRSVRMFVLLILIVTGSVGCMPKTSVTDTTARTRMIATAETNEHINPTLNSTKIYTLKADKEDFLPQIIINEHDKTFSFSYDVLSSYLATGTYTESNGQLKLRTDDGKYYYIFDVTDDNTLKFNQKHSSEVKLIDKTRGDQITDGAEFIIDFSSTRKNIEN